MISSRKSAACRPLSSRVSCQMASSTSRGSRPETARTANPAAIRRFSPATRTMKNSSRLLVKIARNLTRSSSGSAGSSASSSTRRLKCSHDSSRSRKRSSYFCTAASASSCGAYGTDTSNVSSGTPP